MIPKIKIIECPRDAMQGIHRFIDTDIKLKYLDQLLNVGFDTIDFGSFVSPKAIPQMRDTHELIQKLNLNKRPTSLLAIIANLRGAIEASKYDTISYLGYPFSVSETFQVRNTNSSIEESFETVKHIQDIAINSNKKLIVYLSMAFGNPYGDPWNAEIVSYWADQLIPIGCNIIALSDTIGIATPESIHYLFSHLIPAYPQIEFGAHLHTVPALWQEKIEAAYKAGCVRYDGAIKGYGGCPMAKDDLTGNMPTEHLISFFNELGADTGINMNQFEKAMLYSNEVFL